MIPADQYFSFQLTFNKVYCLQILAMLSLPGGAPKCGLCQEHGGAWVPITLLFHVSVQGLHLNLEPQSISTRLEDTQGQALGRFEDPDQRIISRSCFVLRVGVVSGDRTQDFEYARHTVTKIHLLTLFN